MRWLLLTLAVLAFAGPQAALAQNVRRPSTPPAERPADDPIVEFSKDDPELMAATRAALQTLPAFWVLFDTDRVVAQTGMLKMAFPMRGGGAEHMWLNDLERRDGAIYGTLNNYPAGDVGYSQGDRVRIDPDLITDWSYIRDGRLYGSYTTRAMLDRAPADVAERLRQILSDRPLEGSDI